MTPDDLVERANDLDAFDTPEVTEAIERLTAEEVKYLSERTAVVRRLLEDVQRLQGDLNETFVDREEVVLMILVCAVAHLPGTLLGPPGTAKSAILRRFSYGLGLQSQAASVHELNGRMRRWLRQIRSGPEGKGEGGSSGPGQTARAREGGRRKRARRYFEWLMTRFTTPEEILGPAHLQLMIHRAVFYRQTAGLLPEAEVAFLDEFTRANSAILNALLTILNERLFFNAGWPVRVPLCILFGAINEPPREPELMALYDRFPVRVLCTPVEDSAAKVFGLLQKSMDQDHARVFGPAAADGNAAVRRRATVNHFRLLHRVTYVRYGGRSVGDDQNRFAGAYRDTFLALRREFLISDRSMLLLYRAARALALLRGHDELQPSELQVFKYCFQEADTAPVLAEAVEERVRRYDRSFAGVQAQASGRRQGTVGR